MNDKPLSIKKSIAYNIRSIKLFFKKYPKAMISRSLFIAWSAITPYVPVYLSALIINELAGEKNVEKLILLVSVTLISSAVISLISAFLKKIYESQNAGLFYKISYILSEKSLELDYKILEDPNISELSSTIKQNCFGGGWGLTRVLSNFENLINNCFTLFGGVALTISLFAAKVPESAGKYVVLNSPLLNIFIVAIMLAITLISPILSNFSGAMWAKHANDHNLGNRLFGYFGFLGHRKHLAMDVRIYRFNKICEKHNRMKDDTFGSNGIFAKTARGKAGVLEALAAAISMVFVGLTYLFVCLKAICGAFGLGSVTQYVSAITMFSNGLKGLIATIGTMRNNAKFLELTYQYLDIESDMKKGDKNILSCINNDLVIEFKNVSFKYPSSDDYALKNVNLKLNLNNRLAVVGMNGSGKTTFIKLLCRLYDPTSGEIYLNGINIKDISYEEYLSMFSVVFQDFKLLALKLNENVASGTTINREQVMQCLDKAGFSDNLKKNDERA